MQKTGPMVLVIFLTILGLFTLSFGKVSAEKPQTHTLKVSISAPADFIYPYLIYEDKIALWNKDKSVEVTFPKGIEPKVGKQIRVSLKNVPTHPWMLLEIKQLDPGKEVLTEFVDGVLSGQFLYRLEKQNEKQTLFVHEMQIKPVGFLVTVVWEVHGKRVHREKMERFMGNIKQVVEAAWQEELKRKADAATLPKEKNKENTTE